MAAACLDAYDATGNIVYEMMAEELAHYAMRTMWDDERGGFFDRAADEPADGDRPACAIRLKPFAANCEAARVLRPARARLRRARVSPRCAAADAGGSMAPRAAARDR